MMFWGGLIHAALTTSLGLTEGSDSCRSTISCSRHKAACLTIAKKSFLQFSATRANVASPVFRIEASSAQHQTKVIMKGRLGF